MGEGDHAKHGGGGSPFALVERTGKGLILTAVNPAARMLGLHRGQAHADARAIVPHLESAPAEPERETAALIRLALWAERFSPSVAIDQLLPGYEGLFLDMTGGAHLFGGEEALLAELETRLKAARIPARLALADTPGAAWALARFGRSRIAAPGRTREALADLPAPALRLGESALNLLRRFGLSTIGDLYPLPRGGLARRFRGEDGLHLVRRLDQALGLQEEALTPVRPAPLYRAWRVFAEPLLDMEGVGFVLPELAAALAAQLERDGKGARRIRLVAFRVDGRTTAIEAGLGAPAVSPAHLIRLLKEKGLDRLDLGFGADALMLCALKAERADARQGDIETKDQVADDALTALIDRIEAKLGEGAAARPVLIDSHIPERGEGWGRALVPFTDNPACGERPLLLLDPPEAVQTLAQIPDGAPGSFVWRRASHRVVRAEGPERLAPEWWLEKSPQNPARTRDYYRVEDEDGRRYWLYREGLYGREDVKIVPSKALTGSPETHPAPQTVPWPPTWWMHGVFT